VIGEKTRTRITAPATWERLEGKSQELLLQTSRKLSWTAAPTSVKHGIPFVIAGRVTPAPTSGETLSVTVTDGAKLKRAIQVDPLGTFTTTVTELGPGIVKYQVSSPSEDRYLASSSDFVTVVVR